MVVLRPQEVLFRSEMGQGFRTIYDRKHPQFRGGGVADLAPFGDRLIRNVAIGAIGNALKGVAQIGSVPKERRKEYAKAVGKSIVSPTNLIAMPTAMTVSQMVADRLLPKNN